MIRSQFVERRRAEEERERFAREAASERARFEAVLRQMPAGVFIAESDGRFFLYNEEAERIYGRPIRSVEECGRHTYSYPDGGEIPPEHYPLNRSNTTSSSQARSTISTGAMAPGVS